VDGEKPNCTHASPSSNDASETPKDSAAITNDNNGRRAIVVEKLILIVGTKKFISWLARVRNNGKSMW